MSFGEEFDHFVKAAGFRCLKMSRQIGFGSSRLLCTCSHRAHAQFYLATKQRLGFGGKLFRGWEFANCSYQVVKSYACERVGLGMCSNALIKLLAEELLCFSELGEG